MIEDEKQDDILVQISTSKKNVVCEICGMQPHSPNCLVTRENVDLNLLHALESQNSDAEIEEDKIDMIDAVYYNF